MRKLLIAVIVVLEITTANGQDTVKTNFDFSIELLTDTVYRSSGGKVIHVVSTYPPRFIKNLAVFYFDIESYNITNPDTTILINNKRQTEAVLRDKELNAVLYDHRVYEWLESLYSPNPLAPDSVVIKELGKLVYDYKVLGGN